MDLNFVFLDKNKKDVFLPRVFSILHSNMSVIAPTGNSYVDDERIFLENVAPALDKAPRQIVLFFADDELVGYFQYYVNGGIFMMEEIQLVQKHQGSGVVRDFYRWLLPLLPNGITYVEAYSNKKNTKSQSILRHLGLEVVAENNNNYHFRGEFMKLYLHYFENA